MSIEAMKLALEALEEGVQGTRPLGVATLEAIGDLRQAIEQAEKQEPVMGVEVKRVASGGFTGNVWWIHENLQEGAFDLYTTPQPHREWVGLTDEEERECWTKSHDEDGWLDVEKMIELREAKLKERNHVS